MLVAVLVAVPESLPLDRRHSGRLRAFAVAGRQVLANRRYVGSSARSVRHAAAAGGRLLLRADDRSGPDDRQRRCAGLG
jgi:hypothetical protein